LTPPIVAAFNPAGDSDVQHRRSRFATVITDSMSPPRTTTPSGSTISTAALTARLAILTSANVGTVRGNRFAA
jgi:hypothetical protein